MAKTDYFVLFDGTFLTKEQFIAQKEDLAKQGYKVSAVIFDCKSYERAREIYFAGC